MSPQGLTETVKDEVIVWTLDNPRRRNAVHPDTLEWISQRCRDLRDQVVVLRGAGDVAFCAGFDLTALRPSEDGSPPDAPLTRASEAIESSDATFIAAINGMAIGAGLELACACDIRIAREDTWCAVPAAKLGVVYHAAGLQRLNAVLGTAITRRMLLLAERVDTATLHNAGALTHLVPFDALAEKVDEVIDALRGGSPISLRAHRSMLRRLERGPVDAQLLAEHATQRSEAYAALAKRRTEPEAP